MSAGGQASLSDLKEVLKDTLQARGSLDQIRARVRSEIFAALDDQTVPKPKLSNENLLINELIRDYLEYNGYRHALSVFIPESGQPQEKPFDRAFMSSELNVVEDPRFKHVPLLYSIVAGLQEARENNAHERHAGLERTSTRPERNEQVVEPSPRNSVAESAQEPAPLQFRK